MQESCIYSQSLEIYPQLARSYCYIMTTLIILVFPLLWLPFRRRCKFISPTFINIICVRKSIHHILYNNYVINKDEKKEAKKIYITTDSLG